VFWRKCDSHFADNFVQICMLLPCSKCGDSPARTPTSPRHVIRKPTSSSLRNPQGLYSLEDGLTGPRRPTRFLIRRFRRHTTSLFVNMTYPCHETIFPPCNLCSGQENNKPGSDGRFGSFLPKCS